MNLKKILFISSILGILSLTLISQTIQKEMEGIVEKITYSENKITITLENSQKNLIIFENKILNLKRGDKIFYKGKNEIYKNNSQILINSIEKNN
jgi:DNA/RNA endonuclease YhcR with UshA esterase domain